MTSLLLFHTADSTKMPPLQYRQVSDVEYSNNGTVISFTTVNGDRITSNLKYLVNQESDTKTSLATA